MTKNMKIKQIITGSLLAAVWLTVVQNASATAIATTVNFFDSRELGFVNYGIPSDGVSRTTYLNTMIGLSLGGSAIVTTTSIDNTVTRSMNNFGPLAQAVLGTQATYGSDLSSVNINLGTGGYLYLLAKYDGPNYGSEVWYVGGLSGIITIPGSAASGQYGISGTALFTGSNVPDAGSTALMLGAALSGLSLVSRRLKK